MSRIIFLYTIVLGLAGCASLKENVADDVKPKVVAEELKSSDLLDVAIITFDSEELSDKEITELGLSEEIRRSEERYIPIHLKYTLQRTGYWGTVRVVPKENATHLQVRGTIVHSDGQRLTLEIAAFDSRNVKWFEKSYSENLDLAEYSGIAPGEQDPFQNLYNTIANDLVAYRLSLSAEEMKEIHAVSELLVAKDMAPDAFGEHLAQNKEGRYQLVRRPAQNDPMVRRVQAIQARDDMLLDTINNYYDVYYNDLWQPYADWRKLYNEELVAMRKVQKDATFRKVLGIASILGGVLLSSNSDVNTSGLPEVMVIGGAAAIYSGFQKSEETKIHKEVIEELSISFASEAEPLVIEVVGETVRLNGSAEEQYRKWREMLRDIYAQETGLPLKPSVSDDSEAIKEDGSKGIMQEQP